MSEVEPHERFLVQDMRKYGHDSMVTDNGQHVFSCKHELAEPIAKLLNAALFSKYEVRRLIYEDVLSVAREVWATPDFAVEDGRNLYCRFGETQELVERSQWRKGVAVLDADHLIALAKKDKQ